MSSHASCRSIPPKLCVAIAKNVGAAGSSTVGSVGMLTLPTAGIGGAEPIVSDGADGKLSAGSETAKSSIERSPIAGTADAGTPGIAPTLRFGSDGSFGTAGRLGAGRLCHFTSICGGAYTLCSSAFCIADACSLAVLASTTDWLYFSMTICAPSPAPLGAVATGQTLLACDLCSSTSTRSSAKGWPWGVLMLSPR